MTQNLIDSINVSPPKPILSKVKSHFETLGNLEGEQEHLSSKRPKRHLANIGLATLVEYSFPNKEKTLLT